MRVICLKDEAEKLGVHIEEVMSSFETAVKEGKIQGLFVPTRTEFICFEAEEIEAFVNELSSGKVSLANLADDCSLSLYHTRLIIQHLVKIKRVKGDLTYNSFISKITLKKTLLKKASEQKREHKRKLSRKKR